MSIQTLVVTTKQSEYTLTEKMNIQTDAIVGNQCGENSVCEIKSGSNIIKWISTDTCGVGINRNEILMRAGSDICVFADDDMVFKNGYPDIVSGWFNKIPDADIIIFNLDCVKKRYINTKVRRINKLNYGRYGAARIAVKRNSIMFNGISFHTQFGGGCKYSCGEDSIFLKDCLDRKLHIYAVPETIASISDDDSTWFEGYNDKYFFDKGVLFYVLNRKLCGMVAFYHCIRCRKKYKNYGAKNAFLKMLEGIRSVRR